MGAARALATLMQNQEVWVEGEAAAHLITMIRNRVATRVQCHVQLRRRLAQSHMHGLRHQWRRWAQPHQSTAC